MQKKYKSVTGIVLTFLLPVFIVGALTLTHENGILAGTGYTRTHDFPVTATEFDITISDPDEQGIRTVDVTVPVKAIDTGRSLRNFHLTLSMLDAETYPEVTYHATTDAPLAPGLLTLDGELTINGVTKSHPLELTLVNEGAALFARGDTRLALTEFELPLVGMGPMKLLDKVDFSFDIEVQRD